MPDTPSQFSRLIELAKEPSSEKRRELLREVTELFIEGAGNYSDVERESFGDIMSRVSIDMDAAVRRRLAERLADQDHVPHSLIKQLADDEFSVAQGVIERSKVLRDEDLVTMAKGQDQNKLASMASRATISEALADAIVDNGNDQAVAKLVGNEGAKVSRSTFRKVVERSEDSELLQAPLVARKDLPADMLSEMITFVSDELRAQAQARLDQVPPEVLEAALRDAESEVVSDMKSVKDADRKAMVYIAEMARKKQLNEALLVQLSRYKQATELIHAFARLGEIDVKTSRRIINSGNVEGVAIVCRSMRFERSTFSAIAMSFARAKGDAAQTITDALDLYEQVSAEAAQRVMRFWRVRKDAVEPVDQLARAM